MTTLRLATVGPLSGTRAVSTGTRFTRAGSMPSASAANWVITVSAPWPISVRPTATEAEPSA